jgi:hypothetical protein
MVTASDGLMKGATGVLHDPAEAELILLTWRFLYPEKFAWIREEERRFFAKGASISDFEAHVSGKMQLCKPELDAQQEERKRLIADPVTRGAVVPRNEGERVEIERLNAADRDRARAAELEAQTSPLRGKVRTAADRLAAAELAAPTQAAVDAGVEAQVRRELAERRAALEARERALEEEKGQSLKKKSSWRLFPW